VLSGGGGGLGWRAPSPGNAFCPSGRKNLDSRFEDMKCVFRWITISIHFQGNSADDQILIDSHF